MRFVIRSLVLFGGCVAWYEVTAEYFCKVKMIELHEEVAFRYR